MRTKKQLFAGLSAVSLTALAATVGACVTVVSSTPDATRRSDAAIREVSADETAVPDEPLRPDATRGDASTADAERAEDATLGDASALPLRTWTWVPLEGMRCGNGAGTGVGVSRGESDRMVLLLEGGGACWDVATCFVLQSASNLEQGFGAAQFASVRAELERTALLDRAAVDNPLRDATYVFVPYCTGDIHAGDRVATYEALGMRRDVHHVGARNLDAALAYLRATFTQRSQVFLTGFSAGGYGVVMNWHRVAAALAPAPVDALSDCGDPVSPPDGRYTTWYRQWNLQTPPGCDGCDRDLLAVLGAQLRAHPTRRYAQLAYTDDAVLSAFYGVAPAAFAPLVRQLTTTVVAAPNARAFVVSGSEHVMTPRARSVRARDGALLFDFVRAWAQASADWQSHTPY